MLLVLKCVLTAVRQLLRPRGDLVLENLALRHQLEVLTRNARRPTLQPEDRLLWPWLSRLWPEWRQHIVVVRPDTVVRWHRLEWRRYWAWRSCSCPRLDGDPRGMEGRFARPSRRSLGTPGRAGTAPAPSRYRAASRCRPRQRLVAACEDLSRGAGAGNPTATHLVRSYTPSSVAQLTAGSTGWESSPVSSRLPCRASVSTGRSRPSSTRRSWRPLRVTGTRRSNGFVAFSPLMLTTRTRKRWGLSRRPHGGSGRSGPSSPRRSRQSLLVTGTRRSNGFVAFSPLMLTTRTRKRCGLSRRPREATVGSLYVAKLGRSCTGRTST